MIIRLQDTLRQECWWASFMGNIWNIGCFINRWTLEVLAFH